MNQPNQHEVAVGGTANNDRPTQDQLNADCWEKVFDCLSFQEIYNMSQTCKRLQRIAGFYGKQYLPAVRGIITVKSPRQRLAAEIEYQNGLNEYINELSISCHLYPEIKLNRRLCAESFPSVKKLTLSGEMKKSQFHHVEGILGQIEALHTGFCKISGNLFVRLLQHCSKLKSIRVNWLNSETHWLHHEYPTLENFEFESGPMVPSGAEMVAFLTINPNIKRLRIKAEFIWANKQAFKEAEIQLDCLAIHGFSNVPIGSFVRLLDELHGRRFYKSLHIHPCWSIGDLHEFVDNVAPLSTLNALNIDYMCLVIDISHLVHLKELHCGYFGDTMDLENLAKNLVNLEQLSICRAHLEDVIPFIRHSKKLSKLRIDIFRGGILDLTKLYSERQKLKDELRGRSPKIVGVYVEEKVYLATKWHMNNVSLDLIELRRTEMVLRIDDVPYNQE